MNMNRSRHTLSAEATRMRSFSTFADYTDEQLERIASAGHHSTIPSGWPLIHEQTPSDACYVILSGELAVYYGREQVATLTPGDIVGEAVMQPGKLRSATVAAVGPVDLLNIPKDDFTQLLNDVPPLLGTVEASASRHTTHA
ncbi:cyclic nucleotide-binding domain-containing protein [Smaragdicoccus niigatensis]|uniref:cyclic nucleotide-binding domain-containing protein n=1 Tax=Smaragdicoccus niigatensis TaxID=359359 RepID=UPI000373ECB2|nr:cyclic nucleotide-binding domain-containing protein [Smaragdicoccus niigatensis]